MLKLAQLMVMKAISVEQLAAEETQLPEVGAVPFLPFPADGAGAVAVGGSGVTPWR